GRRALLNMANPRSANGGPDHCIESRRTSGGSRPTDLPVAWGLETPFPGPLGSVDLGGARAHPLAPGTVDMSDPEEISGPAALARFSAGRARELDRAHRRHRSSGPSSFLWAWAASLLRRTRPSPFAQAAAPLPVPTRGECAITWIGHATALVRYATAQLIVD